VKKKPPYNQNAAIRGALRRQFSRSPVVREVLMKVRREVPRYNKDGSRAKKDAVQYRCTPCGQWTKSTAVSVDHISPVIDVQAGFVDWNQFVARLFCDANNLQVICDTCHDDKTYAERIARLTAQYNQELGEIKAKMNDMASCSMLPDETALGYLKEWKKEVSRYTAKKKTKGLEGVVQKAQTIKDEIEGWISNVKHKKSSK
jgi:5-methylcytosine-specific restriction endonuclease McrA